MPLGVVTRCVCHDITFRELKQLADREGLTLPDLARRTGCTTSCGLCRPYIEVVLATGQTELPVMTEEQCKKMTGR
jgi:bacterioferritin-associated ferredoxin